MTNIVVFASGSGTNFQAIIDAIATGDITDAQINGLVASKPGIGAIERARKNNIPVHVVEKSAFSKGVQFKRRLLEILEHLETDLIVLAGYLQKIPEEVIATYKRRIINIHPALLPKYGGKGFYGERVHRAVLENGDSVSGCTVHYVTEEYDEGPILAQRKVPVKKGDTPDTLGDRVLEQEHKLLPEVIQQIIHDNS